MVTVFDKNIGKEVATDLIALINSCVGFEKRGHAKFSVKGRPIEYSWTLLDDIYAKVKKNNDFAVMQPLGQDDEGDDCVKTVLVHKSGAILESGWFKLGFNENDDSQNKGIKISFMRRYSIGSFLGIVTETDNDGAEKDNPDDVDAEKEKELAKENKPYQKKITEWFSKVVQNFGSKEDVYQVIKIDRETFMVDFKAEPKKLWKQIELWNKENPDWLS